MSSGVQEDTMAEAFRKEVIEIEAKLRAEQLAVLARQQESQIVPMSILRQIVAHDAAVRSLAVAPSVGSLCTGSEDGTAKQWDLGSGELVRTLAGHRDWVTAVCTSGDVLFTGSADCTARSW